MCTPGSYSCASLREGKRRERIQTQLLGIALPSPNYSHYGTKVLEVAVGLFLDILLHGMVVGTENAWPHLPSQRK